MKKIYLLILIFFSQSLFSLDKNQINPPQGRYRSDITITLEKQEKEIYFYFEKSRIKDPVLYDQHNFPIILSASAGEEKNYTIVFTEKNPDKQPIRLNYTIDKKLPPLPDLSLNSSFLSFVNNDNTVFYKLDEGEWRKWINEKIALSEFNTVFYYSKDSAGNKSMVESWSNQNYDNYSSSEKYLKIISPEKGVFYNKQFLYIDKTGFDWIRYSFHDFDSASNGNEYKQPFLVDKTGSISIYLSGKPSGSDEILFSSISYNVEPDDDTIKTEIIEYNNNRFLTAVSEKIILYSVNSNDFTRYVSPLKLICEPDSINFNTVRLKSYDSSSSACYRYFYYYDNRDRINISYPSQVNSSITVHPEKPVLSGIKVLENGEKQVYLEQKKNRSFAYTISEEIPPENPGPQSPVSNILPVLKNPYGRESLYFINVSSVDQNGNISEPLSINNIIVDHYPPDIPDISIKNNLLEFTASDDIYYRITTESIGESFYKKYIKPVNILSISGISSDLKIEYYSSDLSGNRSTVNTEYHRSDNSFPEISNIIDIRKNNLFRSDYTLKKSLFNINYDIYYTISENITPPPDPDLNSFLLENDILFSCPENKEKHYTVKLLPVSKINKNIGDSSTVHFHIDKIKPPEPLLSDLKKIYYSDIAVVNIIGSGKGQYCFLQLYN